MTNEREIKIKYAKLKMEANEKYLNELRDIELEVIISNNEIQKPLNEIQKLYFNHK